jgi:hypothetical protein
LANIVDILLFNEGIKAGNGITPDLLSNKYLGRKSEALAQIHIFE